MNVKSVVIVLNIQFYKNIKEHMSKTLSNVLSVTIGFPVLQVHLTNVIAKIACPKICPEILWRFKPLNRLQ